MRIDERGNGVLCRDTPPGRRSAEGILAVLVGLGIAAAFVVVADASTKGVIVLVGGIVAACGLCLLIPIPQTIRPYALFALAATLSLSIKFHPVFREDHLGGAIGIRISITDLLLGFLVVVAAVRATRSGSAVIRIDWPIGLLAAAYCGWALVSTLAGNDVAMGLFQLSAVIQALILCVCLASIVWSSTTRRTLIAGLLCGLLLQSGTAITQSLRPGLLTLEALGANEDSAEDTGQVPAVDLGTTTIAGDVARRPTGLLIHPNVLAAYFVLTIPLAVAVWVTGRTRWERALALAACCGAAAALYLSLSRSGWVGTAFALGVGAFVVWRRRAVRLNGIQKLVLASACAVVLLGLPWKADRIYLRFTETADEAVQFRKDLALTAWEMVKDHPATGVGLNTFIYHAEAYDASGTTRLKRFPVHNAYLLELAETGFLGGLAFCGLVLVVILRTFAWARLPPAGEHQILVLALAAGLLGFWVTQLSDYVYRIPILTSLVWAHVGIAFGLSRSARAE